MGTTRDVFAHPEPEAAAASLPASFAAVQIPLPLEGLTVTRAGQPGSPRPPAAKPKRVLLPRLQGRCSEKGCVFPAEPGAGGKCVHHRRQQQEPSLYCSHQPSSAFVERSKFGPPREEELGQACQRRAFDRRRQVVERERFLRE